MAAGPRISSPIVDTKSSGKEVMLNRLKEPRLLDLLQDPVMKILMARDGVSRDSIMSLLTWAAAQKAAAVPALRQCKAGAQ
jgi:hypothetical protein